MPFLNDLVVRSDRETDNFILEQPLSYQFNNTVYTVPAGFDTDFASIPKALRSFIDDDAGDIRDAAVIHDWLYSTHEVPRAVADRVLYTAIRELGGSWLVATTVFSAVRAFGGLYYDHDSPYRIKG